MCFFSHPRYEGAFGCAWQLGVTFGQMMVSVFGLEWIFGTSESWQKIFLLGSIFPAVQIILVYCIPESPIFLAIKGKLSEAEDAKFALHKNRNVNKITSTDRGMIESFSLMLKSRALRNALFLSVMLPIIQQLTGINAIMFYSTQILIDAGVPDEWSGLATVGVGFINMLGVVAAIFLIEKTGRRRLFLLGLFGCGLFCFIETLLLSDAMPESSVIDYLSIIPVLLWLTAGNMRTFYKFFSIFCKIRTKM